MVVILHSNHSQTAEVRATTYTDHWTPPGAAISNYQYSTNNGSTWTTRSPASAASPLVITGLANGTTYQVKLRAVNAAGAGTASAAVAATPRTVPGAPTGLKATADDKSASIAFTAPANNGGAAISNYQYSTNNGASWTTPKPAVTTSPLAITGLTNGTTYQVKLRAMNAAGLGAASAAVTVTPAAPGPAGNVFVAVTPGRVVDTRTSEGGAGPIPAGEQRVFSVATTQNGATPVVPAGATAVVYNLTVPNPSAGGHLRVMPGDATELTTASAINFRPGETITNGLTVGIDTNRTIRVHNAAAVPVAFLVDIVGYYSATGALFYPTDPTRVYDSRTNQGGPGPIPFGPDGQRDINIAHARVGGAEQVPTGAVAIAYNIAATATTTSGGHLRAYPAGTPLTGASTLNWPDAGYTRANGTNVAINPTRTITVYNGSATPTDTFIDTLGYYK